MGHDIYRSGIVLLLEGVDAGHVLERNLTLTVSTFSGVVESHDCLFGTPSSLKLELVLIADIMTL